MKLFIYNHNNKHMSIRSESDTNWRKIYLTDVFEIKYLQTQLCHLSKLLFFPVDVYHDVMCLCHCYIYNVLFPSKYTDDFVLIYMIQSIKQRFTHLSSVSRANVPCIKDDFEFLHTVSL